MHSRIYKQMQIASIMIQDKNWIFDELKADNIGHTNFFQVIMHKLSGNYRNTLPFKLDS
jgi:hypothetical protein